jgi:2-C-methyl-D-erythritol 4-phosphate cytidylyltransferase
MDTNNFIVIVPAAGVGKRMQANCPKQYLTINSKTVLSHTLSKLLSHPRISQVVLALSENDQYFNDSDYANHSDVIRVNGGKERVDSVLNGLSVIDVDKFPWVLVHDAARPCLSHSDIDKLLDNCLENNCGGLLATPVRDTMKRGFSSLQNAANQPNQNTLNKVKETVERSQLWHALTPQLYKTAELSSAIEEALAQSLVITDESSAMELAGFDSILVAGSSENIKITHPDDLVLAEFFLNKQAGIA